MDGCSFGGNFQAAAWLDSVRGPGAANACSGQAVLASRGLHEIRRVWGRVVPMTDKGVAC